MVWGQRHHHQQPASIPYPVLGMHNYFNFNLDHDFSLMQFNEDDQMILKVVVCQWNTKQEQIKRSLNDLSACTNHSCSLDHHK